MQKMRVKSQQSRLSMLVGTAVVILATSLLVTVVDAQQQTNEETLIGADSNSISVLDPRKLTRTSNPNALAINSLTSSPIQATSQSVADGKSNDTHLIFATHVTERAPQLANQAGLTNQLGQTVYLQAQPQPQQQQQQQHQSQQGQQGQFLYPQPAPVQGSSIGHQGNGLNAPGASAPYLLHPGYGVQYVQYVPRPVVMPNYPPPPSVYGQHPAHYSNVPLYSPLQPHHPHAHFPGHPSQGIPHAASQFILPPPPGHHTIPSPLSNYGPHHHHQQASLQPLHQQQQPQSHHHHPQTHFLVGPSHPSPPSPTQTYASGSAVGQHQQSQLQSQAQQQAQATAQPSTYLTYSPQSQHYQHSQQQQQQHQQQVHPQSANPTAQSTNIVPNLVQPPQQQFTTQQQQQQQQQQPLIGSYSHQSPLYTSYSPQPQAPRFVNAPQDSFLNTNEYLPVQFDHSQYRPIKRRNAKF